MLALELQNTTNERQCDNHKNPAAGLAHQIAALILNLSHSLPPFAPRLDTNSSIPAGAMQWGITPILIAPEPEIRVSFEVVPSAGATHGT